MGDSVPEAMRLGGPISARLPPGLLRAPAGALAARSSMALPPASVAAALSALRPCCADAVLDRNVALMERIRQARTPLSADTALPLQPLPSVPC